VHGVITAGAGFLLAVLWFDLMFDVQVRDHDLDEVVPAQLLASIRAYYRRVTTDAAPRNQLVAAAMVVTLGAIAGQLALDDAPRWVSAVSLVAAAAPIGLAGRRTVPAAKRLGAGEDPVDEQRRLATAIYADHRFCLASIALLLFVQLVFA
jgi:hypothetical protein